MLGKREKFALPCRWGISVFKTVFSAAALSLAALAPVGAVTVTQSATPTTAILNPTTLDFSGTYSENVSDPGLVPGTRRSPWEGTSLDGSVYSSITGEVTYTFGSLHTSFSLVWGSPDSYNSLEFYNGTTLVATILGTSIVGCCGGNIVNSLVTISDLQFDSVTFISGTPAFEYANISAAVPLPAGGLLLLGALGGLAALRRRKMT
jgi:hypothetical protein